MLQNRKLFSFKKQKKKQKWKYLNKMKETGNEEKQRCQ